MEEIITLGGGCFWCTESVFLQLKGVEEVQSGYSGGQEINPTYEQVSSSETGHAEVVQITFNPEVISLHDLLYIFFTLHDPTTVNRQGADVGTQYRSVIFYRSAGQQKIAEAVMKEIEEQNVWPDPLVTTLEPFQKFYLAEDYHQNYFARNSSQPYCQAIIAPKVSKLRRLYKQKLAN